MPYPCLTDRLSENGYIRGHYFNQDLFIANRVYLNNPKFHVDVGSRIDGFVAHVASFRAINVIDIRPTSSQIDNIKFIQMDLKLYNKKNLTRVNSKNGKNTKR